MKRCGALLFGQEAQRRRDGGGGAWRASERKLCYTVTQRHTSHPAPATAHHTTPDHPSRAYSAGQDSQQKAESTPVNRFLLQIHNIRPTIRSVRDPLGGKVARPQAACLGHAIILVSKQVCSYSTAGRDG